MTDEELARREELIDAELLAIAEERLAHFDPARLIPQEEMWKTLGITEAELEAVGDVEFE